ncbi:MAG: BtpA/SgcQ family protein, partial [Acidimicrobiia bacterium]
MNRLIAVVHLPPLPGAPRYSGDLSLKGAVRDAGELEHAGFDSLIVENFGDVPFYPDDVPATTVAAMTRAVLAIQENVSIPVGLNVLRNDGLA